VFSVLSVSASSTLIDDVLDERHRNTAPRFGAIYPGATNAMLALKWSAGLSFIAYPEPLRLSRQTFWDLIEGRGALTHKTLCAVALLAAVLDLPSTQVCAHELPPVAPEGIVACLEMFLESAKTPHVKQWAQKRIAEVNARRATESDGRK